MQQVLYIGGGNVFRTREDFEEQLKTWDYDPFQPKKKRKYTLQHKLWASYQVAILDMPNKNLASYTEWKIQFEKTFEFLDQTVILVAHSLGTTFIMKYLIENAFPVKISQLHLVSPVFTEEGLFPWDDYLGNFNFDATRISEIQGKCEKIFIYHSKDDNCVPFVQGEKVAEYLPQAQFEIFEDQGHFSCEEFPQLIENIKNS